jgi:hypothetical protein
MKLNPPDSSSDLDSARDIARRLSSAAYGRRAGRRWDGKKLSAHVDTDDAPLSEVGRATSASLARAPRAPEAERPVASPPPSPAPSPEALAPHAEPPLAAEAAAPAVEETHAEAGQPAEARHDAPHAPRGGKSRVDALLEQALGRTAAVHAAGHRAEPVVHEPFVPLPVAEPEPVRAEETAAEPAASEEVGFEPPAEEPAAPETPFEAEAPGAPEPSPFEAEAPGAPEPSPFEAEEPPSPAAMYEPDPTGPLPVPEPPPFDEEPAAASAPEASPFDEPAPPVDEPPIDEPLVDEPPIGEPFDAEPPAADASPFDPDDLVGSVPAVAPEPAPPPALPEWPEVLAECLKLATTAKGALVAGRDGNLVAGTGQWPARPDVIAAKLVPLIQKAGRSATDEPLSVKLGPNTLSAWQFEEDGQLLTAALISDAPLPAGVWPGLKVLLRRQ